MHTSHILTRQYQEPFLGLSRYISTIKDLILIKVILKFMYFSIIFSEIFSKILLSYLINLSTISPHGTIFVRNRKYQSISKVLKLSHCSDVVEFEEGVQVQPFIFFTFFQLVLVSSGVCEAGQTDDCLLHED